MSLKKFISKFKNKIIKESYVKTEVIYNHKTNFMILISFTQNYFNEAIEFLAACNDAKGIRVKYVHSSYEEDNKKDENGNPIIHIKNYILIGGTSEAYCNLYYRIDNIANSLLNAITKEIYNYRYYVDFKDLSLFYFNDFKYYDSDSNTINYDTEIKACDFIYFDDAKKILSKLPIGFTGQNILKFINIYSSSSYWDAYTILYDAYYKESVLYKDFICHLDELFNALTKNPTDTTLKNFVGPQYLVQDDDVIPGDLTDESLDEVFRQEYDKFNAVRSDDLIYEDIDEQLVSDIDSDVIQEEPRLLDPTIIANFRKRKDAKS